MVDAVREGQRHVGSTPTTSTNFLSARRKKIARRSLGKGGQCIAAKSDKYFPSKRREPQSARHC
jgi:hypothetical protein